MYQLENELKDIIESMTYHQMEIVNNIITRIIHTAIKKVEGMRRNMPY